MTTATTQPVPTPSSKPVMSTSRKTRLMYTVSSLGMSIPVEAVSGIIMFYVVDVMNLPVKWFATFWVFYTIYNACNNPVLGYMSDRTKSRWGRRIPYVLFGSLPYGLAFALLFMSPFDGRTNPLGLLLFFGTIIIIWEGLYTAVAAGYYALLPEMFPDYEERTDVAAKMQIFQTGGLIIGVALPPILSKMLGWTGMGILLGAISIISLYIGVPFMFEKRYEPAYVPFIKAVKATFANKAFVLSALAQAMRFFGTGTLQAGMMFYMKYSLKVDEGLTTAIFGIAFVVAAIFLYPWRWLVANRFDSRTTLALANAVMIVGVIPLGLSTTLPMTLLAAVIIGIGLSGLILIGDVIVSEVIDDDEVRTGSQRAGMYFGVNSFLFTLSGMLVSVIFGLLMPRYGYDTLLEVQPATVGAGFRIFLGIPTTIGFLLAIVCMYFYPLHGQKLKDIKAALKAKNAAATPQAVTK